MTIFGFALNRKEGAARAKSRFWFQDEDGVEGNAKWFSVAAQGACICLDRELEAGQELTIYGKDLEIHGRIVWCRAMVDQEHFVAGVRILRSQQGTCPADARLAAAAANI